ncbi:MAG TPA: hypothetical protein PL017_09635 [Tenuifilaceae bacterium]|nr:hypothetical protein [Tenuifilaceae bacterium]HPJ46349.1 hypothetical protein [Tenuifilaceae bacterium]HPQ34809.1 hypothetical protein [Tenuifilaceae bacterium]
MKRRRFILHLLSIFILASCVTHYFDRPIPVDVRNYNQMPKEIQGNWTSNDGEDIVIDKTCWTLNSVDSTGEKQSTIEFIIPDSLTVKRWRKSYYFNKLESNGYWTVYYGQKEGEFFYIKGLGDDDTLAFKQILNLEPTRIEKTSRYYSAPLKKKQLKKFASNGGFCDTLMVFDLKKRELTK